MSKFDLVHHPCHRCHRCHPCPQVLGVAEKRRAALKRKLAALQASANEKLADAERKVAKINQQASKLPSLGKCAYTLTSMRCKLKLTAGPAAAAAAPACSLVGTCGMMRVLVHTSHFLARTVM